MANLTDDVLKWTLDINGQPAMKELNQLEQSTKDLERTNKDLRVELQKMEAAGKKNTDEYKRLQNQMKGNKATIEQNKSQMDKLRKEVGLNALTAKQLRQEYRRLKTQMDNTTPNTPEWKRLDKELNSVKNRLGQVNGIHKNTNKVFGDFKAMLPTLGFAAIAIGIVNGLKNIAKQALQVRAEFEKFEAVLKNTLGSESAAKKSIKLIQDFAARTPFSVQELTGSFVKLANQGFVPTADEMRRLGDLASSTGKSFDQLTEALIDAQVGEFERLKEFGIRAQKQGDIVKFTFKGVTTETKFADDAIRDYITSLGDMKGVTGSMAAISETVAGRMSNLGDAWDSLLNVIGQKTSGVFKNVLDTFINTLNSMITQANVAQYLVEAGLGGKSWYENMFGNELLRQEAEDMIEIQQGMVGKSAEEINATILQISKKIGFYSGEVGSELNKLYAYTISNLQSQILESEVLLKKAEEKKKANIKTEEQKINEYVEKNKLKFEEWKKANDEFRKLQEEYQKNNPPIDFSGLPARTDEENIDDGFSDPLAGMDRLFEEQKLKLDEQRAAGLISEQEHNILLEDVERAHLITMLNLREQLGMDTLDIEKELAQKQIEEQKRVEQEKIASQQRIFDNVERFQYLASNFVNSMMDAELANAGENEEKKKEIRKKYAVAQFLINASEITADTAMAVMKAVAASPLTGGLPWSAIVAGIGALQIATAYAEMNKVRNMWTGGFTGPGEWDKPQGIVHSNEFVANRFATQNPTVRPVLDMIDYAQRSGNISNLNLPAAMAAAPGTKEIIRENNTTVDPTSIQIMAELRDELKKGIRSYVVANQDYARAHTEYMDKYNKRINQRS